MPVKRLSILIQGTVQGVGFRPCVFALAKKLHLTGFVRNQGSGVAIEIQGRQTKEFLPKLHQSLPKLAILDNITTHEIAVLKLESDFVIKPTDADQIKTLITPDITVCDACLNDLYNPDTHYYLYPFLNCTQCGPRFSITRLLPYDRCHTSMDKFILCSQCQYDYDNPNNRRHHAQPTACCHCGPSYTVPIGDMAKHIQQGNIIAVKGLGGYQLICDAQNSMAIERLRDKKGRPDKPFALMIADIDTARLFVEINEAEAVELSSDARPIVLLNKGKQPLPENLAPRLNQLGVMLPSTPLHHLLFKRLHASKDKPWVLVVTSANCSGDPIIAEDGKAQQMLNHIADVIIPHDRPIVARVDDSVVRLIDSKPMLIRRARGYVPKPIQLAKSLPNIVALGAQQKNTLCLIREDQAFVSQYMGSLSSPESIVFFEQTFQHWLSFLNIEPELFVHDCHPDFFTSQWVEQQSKPSIAVQHHHAHLASVIAEHHLDSPCLGLALDGYGYGPQGQAWGGELMRLEGAEYQHLSQLEPLTFVGGEQAIREPWRMAASVLHQLGRSEEILPKLGHFPLAKALVTYLDKQNNIPQTSACGRLFDAAAALLGICWQSSFEGQAAMQLESLVSKPTILTDGWCLADTRLSFSPLLNHLADCQNNETGANLFHGTLIAGIAEWLIHHCQNSQINQVVLSGGCLTNRVFTSGICHALKQQNITPFLPKNLPVNDGGISLGQAWIAGLLALEN